MANFGASKPWIARLNGKTGAYESAFKCGELVNTSINPQYNTGSLYGDNRKVEEIRLFKTADITLGVTRIPVQAAEIMFGHKIMEDGSEVKNTGDDGNYVGYAFITQEMESGAGNSAPASFAKPNLMRGRSIMKHRVKIFHLRRRALAEVHSLRIMGAGVLNHRILRRKMKRKRGSRNSWALWRIPQKNRWKIMPEIREAGSWKARKIHRQTCPMRRMILIKKLRSDVCLAAFLRRLA